MTISGETNRIVKQWVEYAEEDLRVAKYALKIKSAAPHKIIAFHAQQCAEKYLKSFLVCKDVDFAYTHNIALLLELSSPHAGWVASLQGLVVLTQYAVTTRYPGKDIVSKKEALKAVELASLARKTVRSALKQEGLIL